jgi:hypothetical protein
MIKMGVSDEDVINLQLLSQTENGGNSAGINQDIGPDEEACRIVIRKLRAVTTQHPYVH